MGAGGLQCNRAMAQGLCTRAGPGEGAKARSLRHGKGRVGLWGSDRWKSPSCARVAGGPVKTCMVVPALLHYKCLCHSPSPDFWKVCYTHKCWVRGVCLFSGNHRNRTFVPRWPKESKAPGNEILGRREDFHAVWQWRPEPTLQRFHSHW